MVYQQQKAPQIFMCYLPDFTGMLFFLVWFLGRRTTCTADVLSRHVSLGQTGTKRKKTIVTCPKTNITKFSKAKWKWDSGWAFLLCIPGQWGEHGSPSHGKVKHLDSLAETQENRRIKCISFDEVLRSLYKVVDLRSVSGANKEVLTTKFWALVFS